MTCFSCLFLVQVMADTILVSFFGSAAGCRFLNSIHLNVLLILSIFTGLCSCSSLSLPRVLHPCKCKFQAWWTRLWKNAAFGSVPWLGTGKVKIKSNKKGKSSLIQSTHFKALVLQLISLCQGPSAKCSFWNSTEEGLGHLQRCSLESHGWRKVPSCPVGYLGAVVFSAVSLVNPTLSHTESVGSSCWWILNPLWDRQSGGFMAVQRLCWAIEHLTSFSMSRAPVSLPENCQGN